MFLFIKNQSAKILWMYYILRIFHFAGMATSENIVDAIYTSRKTIVLMSKHFLKSTWGQFELQQAHYRAIAQVNLGLVKLWSVSLGSDKVGVGLPLVG